MLKKITRSVKEYGLLAFFKRLFLAHDVFYIFRNDFTGPFFRCSVPNAELRIVKHPKTIFFEVYAGNEFAHISKVGFEKNEFYPFDTLMDGAGRVGAIFTVQKYRRMGLNLYVQSEIFKYLKKKGFKMALMAVNSRNKASIGSQNKLGSKIIKEEHSMRVLGFLNFKYAKDFI